MESSSSSPKPKPKPEQHKYKKGDVIWVRTGLGDHEEPATVVKVSCHCDHDYAMDMEEEGNGNGNGNGNDDENENNNDNEDGILVRYNVSYVEAIVHYKNVRNLLDDDDDDNDNNNNGEKAGSRRSSRRSRRISRAATTATPSANSGTSTIATTTTAAANTTKKVQLTRVATVNKDSDDVAKGSRISKRKLNQMKEGEDNVHEEDEDDDEDEDNDEDEDDIDNDDDYMDNEDDDKDNVPISKLKSASSKVTKKRKAADLIEDYEKDGNKKDVTKKIKLKRRGSNKTTSKKSNDKSNATTQKKEGKEKNKNSDLLVDKSSKYFKNDATKAKANTKAKSTSVAKEEKAVKVKKVTKKKSSGDVDIKPQPGAPDGYGGLNGVLNYDAPYTIEYAKTGRSTCKRCDTKIQKNELRVGHRPLFRGKPGFRIYKHLHCIVFSDDVQCVEDVEGYQYLKDETDLTLLRSRIEESLKEVEEEEEELDPDELVQKAFDGEIRERPKGLTAHLLPFQREGVSWMYCQEVNVKDIRGGILADEMGMGKTLQTITTTMDNRPQLQHCLPGAKHPPLFSDEVKQKLSDEEKLWNESFKEWKHEMNMNDVPPSILPKKKKGLSVAGARAGTLVICPVIALTQWKSEIEKFCESGALSVGIYHGPDRSKTMPREMIRKYDVLLTTYQVIEHDFRKMVSPNKVKCPTCGKKFKIDKLKVHLKYFCGETAQRTEAQSRTRRNADRDNHSQSRRDPHGASKQGKGKATTSEKTMSKSKTKSKSTKKIEKKVFKIKGDSDYDSESDFSIQNNSESFPTASMGRSRRAAATRAKGRVSVTAKKEGRGKAGLSSDEDYVESDEDYDAEEESESEDDATIKRAKRSQAKAYDKARRTKGVKEKVKDKKKKFLKKEKKSNKASNKKKAQIDTNNDAIKRKKHGNDSSDSSSSSDDESAAFDIDIDIDIDALIEEAMAGAQMSVLHSFCWWRIVLDEAHYIKSRSSQTSAAAFALTGIHRWCLSGTPLQNRVGEFYSLVRFLRLDPMAHYICRADGCNCKQVHYRMVNGRCKDCNHSAIHHYSYFNRHILNPTQRDGYSKDGRRAIFTLKNEVLDRCLFRRTKDTRAEDMNLPPRNVTIKSIRLHPVEEDFYNAVYTQTTSSFNDYVEEGTLLNNYAHIFDLLMRMRQSVCHPYLVVHSKKDIARRSATSVPVANGSTDCELCHEPPTDRVVSSCCRTAYCKACVLEYMATAAGDGSNDVQCPSCRNPFTIDLNQVQENEGHDSTLLVGSGEKISRVGLPSLQELPHVATGSILRRIDLTEFATSSKIEALTMELTSMRKSSPGSKAIVFSQFVNMLDLIRWRLHSDPYLAELGLGVRAIHGGMNVQSRDAALEDFREDRNVRVLLMSLKAGGVALNLTVANHVYLMDPWWNPAAEMQAIDRTHRLGQHRPIRAVRFIAVNTVEERILQLQEKKRLVFDGTVGRDAGSLARLTVDDMKSLFG